MGFRCIASAARSSVAMTRDGRRHAGCERLMTLRYKRTFPSDHPKKESLYSLKNYLQRRRMDHFAEPPIFPTSMIKDVPQPTKRELYIVGLHQAIPFIGFGFMDNAILILAGESIDIYLGSTLMISTMCAAAIGNIVSDIAGVVSGTIIEDAVARWSKRIEKISRGRVKLPPLPKLTYDQRALRSVRLSSQFGCAIGLTIGCILGMFPLLFFDDHHCKGPADKDGDNRPSDEIIAENIKLKDQLDRLKKENADKMWDRAYY